MELGLYVKELDITKFTAEDARQRAFDNLWCPLLASHKLFMGNTGKAGRLIVFVVALGGLVAVHRALGLARGRIFRVARPGW